MKTIRRSLISGRERKEESRKPINRSPGPPYSTANSLIQVIKPFIRASVDYLPLAVRRLPLAVGNSPSAGGRSQLGARRAGALLAAATAVFGAAAAVHYYQLALTLAHYDARAHLVVARRVFDSLTPGWQQVGAVWLPLPHILNALPVQIDWFYRSGASGIAISIASMALASWSIARLILHATG